MLIGAISFAFADLLLPNDFSSISEHDHLLAQWTGFFYSIAVSGKLALTEKERPRQLRLIRSLIFGLFLGLFYMYVIQRDLNFSRILILYPSILFAVLNSILSVKANHVTKRLTDCINGLVAGLVLGLCYSFLLNLGALLLGYTGFLYFQELSKEHYFSALSIGGPVAFGIASSLSLWSLARLSKLASNNSPCSVLTQSLRLGLLLLLVCILANWKDVARLFTNH